MGKYTVGAELARLTGARLVDNHSIANVIFNVIGTDGVSPLPEGIWERVGQVRAAVLDTIVHLSPPHLSFVFTNYMRGEDAAEYAIFLEFVAIAEIRHSLYLPVLLTMMIVDPPARRGDHLLHILTSPAQSSVVQDASDTLPGAGH